MFYFYVYFFIKHLQFPPKFSIVQSSATTAAFMLQTPLAIQTWCRQPLLVTTQATAKHAQTESKEDLSVSWPAGRPAGVDRQ